MNRTEDRLLDLVREEYPENTQPITLATRLADLGDSLDYFQLVGAIEETFGVDLDDSRGGGVETLADLLALIEEPRLAA